MVCGNKTGHCKTSQDGKLYLCATAQSQDDRPDLKYLGTTQDGQWGKWVEPEAQDNRTQFSQSLKKKQPKEDKPLSSLDYRTGQIRDKINKNPLSPQHRDLLNKRGLTDQAIEWFGFFSDRAGLVGAVSAGPNLWAGAYRRVDTPKQGEARYKWAYATTIDHHDPETKDLAIACLFPPGQDNPPADGLFYCTEGLILKPQVVAVRGNRPVIGVGGASGRLDRVAGQLARYISNYGIKVLRLLPDAGWALNDKVRTAIESLDSVCTGLGITLEVGDWGQAGQPKTSGLDPDEVDWEQIDQANFVPLPVLLATVGGDKKQTKSNPAEIPSWAVISARRVIGRGPQNKIAEAIEKQWAEVLRWSVPDQCWLKFNAQPDRAPGVWGAIEPEFLLNELRIEFDRQNAEMEAIAEKIGAKFDPGYTAKMLTGLADQLKFRLAENRWQSNPNVLPFRNGILKLDTMTFREGIEPSDRLLWVLPYNYDPAATCPAIQNWIENQLVEDPLQGQVLRAAMRLTLTGQIGFAQRFIELIGPGGTGKSTLARLFEALVGAANIHATTLRELETNKFELANLVGKRVLLISDSDRWGGSVPTLKNITGGDAIRIERKFVQRTEKAVFEGLVLITCNEAIAAADYTSGLTRRRLTIPCTRQVAPNQMRNLINIGHDFVSGDFANELPGLVNWCLSLPKNEAIALVKEAESLVPSLGVAAGRAIVDANPLADWANEALEVSPDAIEQIGDSNCDAATHLYPNYVRYCESAGVKSVALKRFGNLLNDLLANQLKIEGAGRKRIAKGVVFTGVRLRHPESESDRLLTGPIDPSNTKPTAADEDLAIAIWQELTESYGQDGFNRLVLAHCGPGVQMPTPAQVIEIGRKNGSRHLSA